MADETVLIVDDDAGFRDVYRRLLGQDGYAVVEAGTPADGEARFLASGARLVLLDLMLPPSGRAMAGAIPEARLIEIPGGGHLPCIEQPVPTTRAVLKFLQPLR